MATTIEALIFGALMARVNSLVLSPALPIAWPNMRFTPPDDQKYLRVEFIPNTAQRVAITTATPHRRIGILQVAVIWPRDGGFAAPIEVAGLVAEHFPADTVMTNGTARVRVTKSADVTGLLDDPQAIMVPVTIEWECMTAL